MITLRKLASLSPGTRGRKLLGLLAEDREGDYAAGLVAQTYQLLGEPWDGTVPSGRDRGLLRHRLARFLGIEAADWDLQAPSDRREGTLGFPFAVWLDDLRSPFNVGSIVRTAEAYGFESVWHSTDTPGIDHPRTQRSAMGASSLIPCAPLGLDALRALWGHRPVFALELGGVPVDQFAFPDQGLVLVGGEELGLSPAALAWADASAGRVSLPLYGRKASLNVGVAFGVLAAHWTAKYAPRPNPARE